MTEPVKSANYVPADVRPPPYRGRAGHTFGTELLQ
jgi:hypothetical protein